MKEDAKKAIIEQMEIVKAQMISTMTKMKENIDGYMAVIGNETSLARMFACIESMYGDIEHSHRQIRDKWFAFDAYRESLYRVCDTTAEATMTLNDINRINKTNEKENEQ